MTRARLFTDDELELLATPLSIRLERAATAREPGDLDAIRALMDLECTAIYDKQSLWAALNQSFIVDNAGQETHDEALRLVAEHAFRPFVLSYRGLGVRERVETLARHLRAAGSTFWVEEDQSRVRFELDPWGRLRLWRRPADWQPELPRKRDGQRYFYPTEGACDPPASLAMLTGARPLTQGRERLPCFLAAEILYFEVLPIELLGMPLAVITIPASPDKPTYFDVYKDGADVPVEAYERVGCAKPTSGPPAEQPGRLFTDTELDRLGTPLSIQVEEAAAAGDWSRLLQISAGMDDELVGAKDQLNLLNAGLLSWVARHLGEDAAERALAGAAEFVMGPAVEAMKTLEIAAMVRQCAMVWRAHGSTFWIEEHDDTFVMRGRPMGACGRMWASRYQPCTGRISDSRVRYTTWGAYKGPASFHIMREPRGITYGTVGYPIYSCHCHMFHEVFPIGRIGRPLWIEEHPLDDPDGETVHVHFKDYGAWPERYYERLGLEKPSALLS